jgi:hypothetical protein
MLSGWGANLLSMIANNLAKSEVNAPIVALFLLEVEVITSS